MMKHTILCVLVLASTAHADKAAKADALFKQGVEAVDRAIALAPGGRLVVEDETLGMSTADELRGELQRGLTRDASDLNPLRVFGTRK